MRNIARVNTLAYRGDCLVRKIGRYEQEKFKRV